MISQPGKKIGFNFFYLISHVQKEIFDIFSRDNKLHTTRNLQYQHLYKVQTDKQFHEVCSGCRHHMFMKWYHWLPQQVHIVTLQVQLISHSNSFSRCPPLPTSSHNLLISWFEQLTNLLLITNQEKKNSWFLHSGFYTKQVTKMSKTKRPPPVPVNPIINQKGKPREKARVQIPLGLEENSLVNKASFARQITF